MGVYPFSIFQPELFNQIFGISPTGEKVFSGCEEEYVEVRDACKLDD